MPEATLERSHQADAEPYQQGSSGSQNDDPVALNAEPETSAAITDQDVVDNAEVHCCDQIQNDQEPDNMTQNAYDGNENFGIAPEGVTTGDHNEGDAEQQPSQPNEGHAEFMAQLHGLLDAYSSTEPALPNPQPTFQEWAGEAQADDDPMEVDEVDHLEAEEKFKKEQRAYKKKVRNSINTTLDDIQFKRLEQADRVRKASKHQREQEECDESEILEENDQGLFVPVAANAGPSIGFNDDDDEEEDGKRRKKRKTSNTPKKTPDKRASKASKNPNSNKTKGKQNSRKTQRQRDDNIANFNSIGSSNVFASAQRNDARPDQPVFQSKNKQLAMTELIASIPEEHVSTAKTDKNQLFKASKDFGHGMCQTGPDGQWHVKGMKSALAHYQMMGSAFMRERERLEKDGTTVHTPAGGLNCDEMGLGKTVMAIAVIVNDRYAPSKKVRTKIQMKPTLIVAPSSLLHQWRDEIYKHADQDVVGPVMMFQSSHDKDDINCLSQQGVVLTTYSQVAKSYPKKIPPVELISAEAKARWWNEHYNNHRGVLHEMLWRRVILDEATAIKNFRSQTSAACSELNAQFRWALTGTPAMNSLEEFYSYFRFVKALNCGSFKLFKKNFVGDAEGKERLIAYMRSFMLRRTHDSRMFNAKLINLPTPAKDTFPCQLDQLHYAVYRIVKERFVETINVISRKGELKSGNVLTLLLRLRQFVAHPLLIQDCIRDLLDDSDFEKIQAVFNSRQASMDPSSNQYRIIEHMRRMLANRDNLEQLESLSEAGGPALKTAKSKPVGNTQEKSPDSSQNEQSDHATPGQAPVFDLTESDDVAESSKEAINKTKKNVVGGAFGLKDDFYHFLAELRKEGKTREIGERVSCAKCGKKPNHPVTTSCQHTYCAECCLEDSQEYADRGEEFNTCRMCGQEYTLSQRYDFRELERKNKDEYMTDPAKPENLMPRKGRDNKKDKPEDIINQWIAKDGSMLPSAKTQAFKAQVLNWLEENPKIKIIVYTQFLSMMRILARICQLERWPHLLYHGGMSPTARNNQVKKFREEPFTILFATLTTGGVGLNLTMATRVLMVDPW